MVQGDYVAVSGGLVSKTFGRQARPGEPEEGLTTQFNELVLATAQGEHRSVFIALLCFGERGGKVR